MTDTFLLLEHQHSCLLSIFLFVFFIMIMRTEYDSETMQLKI